MPPVGKTLHLDFSADGGRGPGGPEDGPSRRGSRGARRGPGRARETRPHRRSRGEGPLDTDRDTPDTGAEGPGSGRRSGTREAGAREAGAGRAGAGRAGAGGTEGFEVATLPARDGFPLGIRWFPSALPSPPPAEGPRPIAVVAPALGVLQDFYLPFARWLAERGFTALTFDYRGTGASGGPPSERRVDADLFDWAEDVAGVLAGALAGAPGAPAKSTGASHASEAVGSPDPPLVYVGHSMGLTLLALSGAYGRVGAAVGVATPHAHWRWWRGADRVKMWLAWHVLFPAASRLFGYFPGRRLGFGADLPRGIALQWARWGRRRDYVAEAAGGTAADAFAGFRRPLLALSATDDSYAPPGSVEALLAFFTGAELEHRRVDPGRYGLDRIGHLGFFREGTGEPIWEEIAAWLEAWVEMQGT